MGDQKRQHNRKALIAILVAAFAMTMINLVLTVERMQSAAMFVVWITTAVLIALALVITVWKPPGLYGNAKRGTTAAYANERLNLALRISQRVEWSGPLQSDELWKAEIQDVTPSEIMALNDFLKELRRFSIELGSQVVDKRIEEADALLRIIERFPQLDRDLAQVSCRNGVYIAWRS